ncbi:MAG: class I SAM-dependent methyltransferase [Bacteroidales bacterium]|jgi:ubiquinone/menaquinone biosynthesis C-methylase UbiE|nr:class I SAM-dependent methyltransferase [Bacteroidales bacterium]
MSKENKSIHEFEMNLICEYYSGIERQGPGSSDITIKALSFIDNLTKDSVIADIGCGTGGQTITLAKNTEGLITGVDLFPEFINIFNSNVVDLKLENRVKGIVGSMDNLKFKDEELDLIWSEGAIYNIGFERGIKEWRRFLKPEGFIAVSEATWFTQERPQEIENFWNDAYSEIDTMSNKIEQMYRAGYLPVAAFVLPESCWIDNYYTPQTEVQKLFLKKYSGDKIAEQFIENQKYEAELYYKYKDYYGYVFYIGKKL